MYVTLLLASLFLFFTFLFLLLSLYYHFFFHELLQFFCLPYLFLIFPLFLFIILFFTLQLCKTFNNFPVPFLLPWKSFHYYFCTDQKWFSSLERTRYAKKKKVEIVWNILAFKLVHFLGLVCWFDGQYAIFLQNDSGC